MDLLEGYDDSGPRIVSEPIKLLRILNSNSELSTTTGPSTFQSSSLSTALTKVDSSISKPSHPVSVGTSVRTLIGTVSLGDSQVDSESFQETYLNHERELLQRARRHVTSYSNTAISNSSNNSPAQTEKNKKRARLRNNDASSEAYLGPWGGFEGEDETKESALARGELTLKQKLIRVDLGLDPEGAGTLQGEALESAKKRIYTLVEKEKVVEKEKQLSGATNKYRHGISGDMDEKEHLSAENAARKINKRAQQAANDAAEVEEIRESSSSSSSLDKKADIKGTDKREEDVTYKKRSDDNENENEEEDDDSLLSTTTPACTSTFHGKDEFDYQGRSWAAIPKGVHADGGDHECFVPKRVLQRWSNAGGSKGVQSVSFFPNTGHLMLSASLDGKLKVWDVMGTSGRPLRRTYIGHSIAVRDARFDNDGSRIASVSFDRRVNIWDTESGARINSINVGTKPYCMAWSPTDPSALIVGTSKRRIVQYDLRSGEISIEYDHHLSTVNSITFFDDGKKFVSTGDDKKVLVWEFNTPVPIKYITDPTMHVINAVTLHPSGQYFVGQSMDNTLQVYACGERIGLVSKKVFKGHITAGYACQPSFSPDGHFLSSGDGDGLLWTWDWRTGRVLSKQRAHEKGPCIATSWHPLIPSWVATCGWDSSIALHQ